MKTFFSVLVAIFLVPSILFGEERKVPLLNPVTVSKGPLLFFKQPKKDSKELALYLFDPALHEKPKVLWQDRYHPNPTPLGLLKGKQLLFEFDSHLHLADLASAKVRSLLDDEDDSELVSFGQSSVFFLQKTNPANGDEMGFGLTSDTNGKIIVEKYHRPRDFLFRNDVGLQNGSTRISPLAIESLLNVRDDGFLVITRDEPQRVAMIDTDGRFMEICRFDPHWIAKNVTHSFSPDGSYLALSVLERDQDFHKERTVVVCDLKQNKVCFTQADVPLGLDVFDSSPGFLSLSWRTDRVLEFGGAFTALDKRGERPRFVDVAQGKVLAQFPQTKLKVRVVDAEGVDFRFDRGHFEANFVEAFYPGEEKPVASVLDDRGVGVRDLVFDAKGNQLAYSDPKDSQLYHVDGRVRKKRAIHAGWAHNLMWLEVKAKE